MYCRMTDAIYLLVEGHIVYIAELTKAIVEIPSDNGPIDSREVGSMQHYCTIARAPTISRFFQFAQVKLDKRYSAA